MVGLAIGLFNGFWITRFRVPSFVVTLAGFLAFQGALLYVLGTTVTINISATAITVLARTFLPVAAGWIVAIAVYAATRVIEQRRAAAAGLTASPTWLVITKVGLLAVLALGFVVFLNRDRGFPIALLILLGLVVIFDVITRRTRWGRHVFAVGGNAEAARRAGISVTGIPRLGVRHRLHARGLRWRDPRRKAARGEPELRRRGSAVERHRRRSDRRHQPVRWTRHRVGGAVGALVIQSISNGMDLLGYSSSIKFMVTGGVLLLAVTVDAVSRRSRAQAGLS